MNFMTADLYRKLLKWLDEDKLVRFYQHKTWRKVRQIILNANRNRCVGCGGKATVVHHKQPVKLFPHLALVLDNLEPVCNTCHNKEHPEKLAPFNKSRFTNKERW